MLLSRQYGFTPAEIGQLTVPQLNAYMRGIRIKDTTLLEHEKVEGVEEFMAKVKEAYRRKGREMPPYVP